MNYFAELQRLGGGKCLVRNIFKSQEEISSRNTELKSHFLAMIKCANSFPQQQIEPNKKVKI
jgi:hypothetical protein